MCDHVWATLLYSRTRRNTVTQLKLKKKKILKKIFFLNDTNEPVYTTGNSTQSLGKELDGRYYKKGNVCICMTGALYCTAEIGQIL